ncbi:MAG TPA: hypothetical protein VFW62_01380, partial [bacterium]|nr:hypothetical protein [bacterium]
MGLFAEDPAPETTSPTSGSVLIDEILAQPERDGGGILNTSEAERKIQEGLIKARVEAELSAARREMGSNPDGAEQNLKALAELLHVAQSLGGETRSTLLSQVQNAIRAARRQGSIVKEKIAREREREAQGREQEQLVRGLELKTQRLKQVMERFDALMEEGQYEQADDLVRPEVEKQAPGSIIAASVNAAG